MTLEKRDATVGQDPDGTAKHTDKNSQEFWAHWQPIVDEQYRELEVLISSARPDVDILTVRSAFDLAYVSHRDQRRDDGSPYITHPLAVARIVVELRLDQVSIVAALLHDVVEDTPVTSEQVAQQFGKEVAFVVSGVTKLDKLVTTALSPAMQAPVGASAQSETGPDAAGFAEWQKQQAERAQNLRHLLVSVSQDLRVILVKLADRLHNMRTLSARDPDAQLRTAVETAQVYAPLANRVGVWQLKWELEDLAFRYSDPENYYRVASLVAQTRAERQSEVDEAIEQLKAHLAKSGLPDASVTGRAKHLYSIYQKMVTQGLKFNDIYDLVALRIIVSEVRQCYEALGYVSALWQPIQGAYTDYIARSKGNLYQSIHLKVIGPRQKPIEIQIRTHKMHEIAEYGVAAHWAYKEKGEGAESRTADEQRVSRLRKQLFEMSQEVDSEGGYRTILEQLYGNQIVVFTPRNDPYELPAGATIIDFAYRIHTDVGHHAIGALVAGRFVPLDYECQSGDTIEVATRGNTWPSADWLRHAKTSHARSKINAFLRKQRFDENLERGRVRLQAAAQREGVDPQRLRDEALEIIASDLSLPGPQELLAGVGAGTVSLARVLRRLAPPPAARAPSVKKQAQAGSPIVTVQGLSNVKHKRSRCCLPLPGDDVGGYVTRAEGLSVHRSSCPNLAYYRATDPDRVISSLDYTLPPGRSCLVRILIEAMDRKGLLADVSAVISEMGFNIIRSVSTGHSADNTATLRFDVELRNVEEYSRLAHKVLSVPDVLKVDRPASGMRSRR